MICEAIKTVQQWDKMSWNISDHQCGIEAGLCPQITLIHSSSGSRKTNSLRNSDWDLTWKMEVKALFCTSAVLSICSLVLYLSDSIGLEKFLPFLHLSYINTHFSIFYDTPNDSTVNNAKAIWKGKSKKIQYVVQLWFLLRWVLDRGQHYLVSYLLMSKLGRKIWLKHKLVELSEIWRKRERTIWEKHKNTVQMWHHHSLLLIETPLPTL